MKRNFIAAGACVLAMTGSTMAQENAADQDGATKLDRILISTPLRRESSLARSTSSVIVVDEEAIRQSAAQDLPALLRNHAGVTLTSAGGMGADASVSLRGTSANQTLVLVNGVRAGSATLGLANLSNIPLASIERIEIAKGGHSAQYGSDAIGGIINIITKQGGSCLDGRDACGSVTLGVTHPWGGSLSGNVQGQSKGGASYAFGASILGTQGYDFTLPTNFGHEPDDDGFLQGAFNFSLSKELDWGAIYADGLYARARTQFDRAPSANEANTQNFSGRIGARLDHSDTWTSTVEFMSALDNSTNFMGSVAGDKFDTLRYGLFATTQKSFEIGETKHVALGGIETYRDSVKGSVTSGSNYAKTQRDLAAVFGQYSFEYGALTVDSGMRYDHDKQFGGATTYNIGASYELIDDLVARASYATGFRAPTFNDLYYPFSGNPALMPEKARSYEVGLTWQATERTNLDMALYRNDVGNLIAWAPIDPANPGGFWQPSNINKARITGFEATLKHRFNSEWSGKASIDIRDPLNLSPGSHGKYIAYGERFRAVAELTYTPNEQLSLTGAVLYVRSRYADPGNMIKLPAYITADFTANYALDDHSQIKFSAQNLFDEKYETKQGFRSPGRTLSLAFTRAF